MAYNLADGAERWWVGGLPPCGKSTPVIGGGLLFFAAPDIIMEPVAERRNPNAPPSSTRTTRLASWRFVRAARVKSVRRILPGPRARVCPECPRLCTTTAGSTRSRTAVSFTVGLPRPASCSTPDGWERRATTTPRPSRPINKVYIASAEGVVVVLDAGDELKILATNKLDGENPRDTGARRREHLRENRHSPVRVWKVKHARYSETSNAHATRDGFKTYCVASAVRRKLPFLSHLPAKAGSHETVLKLLLVL